MRRRAKAMGLLVFIVTVLCCALAGSTQAKELNDYWKEGIQAYNAARYQEAIRAWNGALNLAEQQGNEQAQGVFLGNIGNVSSILAQYEKALTYYQKALAIHRRIKDLKGEGTDLSNIGVVYSNLAQYKKALSYYQKALSIHRKITYLKGEGADLSNIGNAYSYLGQYGKALTYYQKALSIHRKITDLKGGGADFANMGVAYNKLGQYGKALSHYKRALAIHRRIKDLKGEGTDLLNIGLVYSNLGQYEKALSYYQEALAIFRKIGDVKGEGGALANIGNVYWHLAQYEKALTYYQKALTIHSGIGAVRGEGDDLNNVGYILLCLGKSSAAEERFESAVNIYESIRGKIGSSQERTGFQSTLPHVYRNLAAARLVQGNQKGAFEAIERGRAKSFLDLLGTRGTGSRRDKGKAAQILNKENQLSVLREKHVKLASAPVGAKTRSVGKALNQQISELDKQRLELIDQLRRADPELGSLTVVDPPNLKEIQSLLAPGTAMVEYFHPGKITVSGKDQDRLWIFVLHSGGFHFKAVDVSKTDLKETLEEYAQLVSKDSSDPAAIEAASAELHEWLIKPVQPITQLTEADTLIIVPWGPMFKIPFAALAPKGGNPLAARKNLVMTPSAGVYRYLVKKRGSGRGKMFAIGNPKTARNPLPGAEKEAKEIAGLFGRSTVRIRDKATESLIKSDYAALGRPDVVHLACHGIFNEREPQLSHLALTPDQKNDGKLEMHEIFDLDWKGVSLVTMSACSSGKGKLGAGDDLVGLTRGFMFAGVPSILCSLWDVDDAATRALMVNFYKNYLGGMSKPESLRKAQMAMMNSGKWSHPYYWSAFVLFGDWE